MKRAYIGVRSRSRDTGKTLITKIFDTLRRNFRNTRTRKMIDLINKLCHLCLQEYKSVNEHAMELRTIQTRLAKIYKKAKRSDLDIVLKFLGGLDSTYRFFKTNCKRNHTFLTGALVEVLSSRKD
jgi:hypothetical protein